MSGKKVALVTGASSGIGRSVANLLADNGFRVFGTTRKETVADSPPGKVEIIQLDVRDDKSVNSCVQKVLGEAGKIDALVNNAGYVIAGSLEEISLDEAKALFETNFFGILRMNQAVLPIMRQQGYGKIANIGSVAGFAPMPYAGIYSASKHAVEGYSASLDHEVRQFGIRVSVIEPGFTRTDIVRHTQRARNSIEAYSAERDRVIARISNKTASGDDPAIVASVVLEALTTPSPRLRYLAGREARALSAAKWLLPDGLSDKILRKVLALS